MGDLTKEIFETAMAGLLVRFDSIDKSIKLLEEDMKVIQQANYALAERIVRLEINLENIVKLHGQCKAEDSKVHEDIFTKIKTKEKEIKESITEKIESENKKQNIKIISTAVGVSGAIMGFVQFIIWMFTK